MLGIEFPQQALADLINSCSVQTTLSPLIPAHLIGNKSFVLRTITSVEISWILSPVTTLCFHKD